MIVLPVSHLDHDLTPAHVAWLTSHFADRTGFFLETVELPAELPPLDLRPARPSLRRPARAGVGGHLPPARGPARREPPLCPPAAPHAAPDGHRRARGRGPVRALHGLRGARRAPGALRPGSGRRRAPGFQGLLGGARVVGLSRAIFESDLASPPLPSGVTAVPFSADGAVQVGGQRSYPGSCGPGSAAGKSGARRPDAAQPSLHARSDL